jgi:hypothetical protein
MREIQAQKNVEVQVETLKFFFTDHRYMQPNRTGITIINRQRLTHE